ncbi:MAG: iron-sulfur cluster assembly scaffold protein [Patescibacteria group bacterium]
MTLYRQEIIERFRFPRHRGVLKNSHAHAEKANMFCGDEIALYLRLDEKKERVAEARFDGQGCALMTASADILCEAVQGKTPDALRKFTADDLLRMYGEAPSPARLKCVLLPYEALKSATSLL